MNMNVKLLSFTAAALLSASTVLAGNNFYGIAASNSNGNNPNYSCRNQGDWNWVAQNARDNGFKSIFVTGFDCDALHLASRAARDRGLTVLAAIYIRGSVDSARSQIDNDVQTFRNAYSEFGAGLFVGLNIGNEVNDNTGAIVGRVNDVRGYLRSVGVSTPISTAHTWVRIRDDPALCSGDYVSANAHAFYDGDRNSHQAGDFLFQTVVPQLKQRCPGKQIIISETGWPSRGSANRAAGVSDGDEREALVNLNCAASTDRGVSVYAFEADDQLWKDNDNERSFGIFNKIRLNGDIFNIC